MKFPILWRKPTETEIIEHLDNKQKTNNTKSTQTIFKPQEKEKLTEPTVSQLLVQKRKFNWLYLLLVITCLGLGILVFRYIQANTPEEKTETNQLARLPVRATKAQIQPIQNLVFGDGQVWAVQRKHLSFEAAGTITFLKNIGGRDLREGDRVRQGELLAKIDDRRLKSDLVQAQAKSTEAKTQKVAAIASIAQAKATIEQAKAEVVRTKAELQAAVDAKDFAVSELKRREILFKEGAIAVSDVDVYRNQVQNAEANVKAAQATVVAAESNVKATVGQLDSAQAQLAASQASIEAARAQQTRSRVNLEDTLIRAPFDGIVAHLNISEGDYWTPQRVIITDNYQSVVDSVPIIVIDPSQYEIYVKLPAFQGKDVRSGQTAYIVLDEDMSAASTQGMTEDELKELARARGKVFAVSPSVTPGERATEVRVLLTEGMGRVRHGGRVSVWIAVAENPQAITVPLNAVIYREQKPYIFVVNQEQKIAELRLVKEGIQGISQQEIKAGINAGDLIITEGRNRLVNGTPIDVIEVLE